MRYGDLPYSLGIHEAKCTEMMFYQYLPIKLSGVVHPIFEERLNIFSGLIGVCVCDFIGEFGLDKYVKSNIYLTVKHLFQVSNYSFNRPGWHSDGFMTDDINYIWCNVNPTVFNDYEFDLTQNHDLSLQEMAEQVGYGNYISYEPNELLRLNQFNIHKVSDFEQSCIRTFFKLSFSEHQYNLIGNSKNHLLNYNWEMKERDLKRNHPTK